MNRLMILAAGLLTSTVAIADVYDSSTDPKSSTAYDQMQEGSSQQQSTIQTDPMQRTDVKNIVGMEVVDAQGNDLGHVEKVVQDRDKKAHLVIEVDEWGIGDKQVVVSADMLLLDAANKNLQIGLDKETLKTQPSYDKSLYFDIVEQEVEAE